MVPEMPRWSLPFACALLAGCFFLPFRPHDDPDPWGDLPYGSDPDMDDDRDGFTETEGDCDDGDALVFPGAVEAANGVDDDCDGETDEPPEPVDEDGDGWTPEDGDCDDADAGVYPGALDACDDLDNDCDGLLNEDAWEDDPQEPNDADPYGFGDITDGAASVAGYLHNADDVDRFSFRVTDGLFDEPEIEVSLSGIPGDADFVLELWFGNDLIGVSDTSGPEEVSHEGSMGHEDEGTYEVVVYSVLGFACSDPYLLEVVELD